MSTTTAVTVVCPRCGSEETLGLRKVEVQIDSGVRISTGQEIPVSLEAEIVANGQHACKKP